MITLDELERFARSLESPLSTEVKLRCAISRAYYVAFHRCKAAAENWCGGLTAEEEKNKGKHEKLYTRLQEHSKHSCLDDELRFIAEEAKKLRALRTTADYHLDKDVTARDVTRGFAHLGTVNCSFSKLEVLANSLAISASTNTGQS